MQNLPLISVIIPCFNQAAPLAETLNALKSQTTPPASFEVLVVDDGSTDQTEQVYQQHCGSLNSTYVRQDNSGASAARNLGARWAHGEILLFLDADMVPSPELLGAHLENHQAHSVGIVEGWRQPWPPAATFLSNTLNSDILRPDPTLNDSRKAFVYLLSCNLSIPKALFLEIGGFDEGLRRWHDIDFAYRAVQMGVAVRFEPQALAYHNHPLTFKQVCQKARQHHRHAQALFAKYPEIPAYLDYLQDKLPPVWKKDSPGLLVRKVLRQSLALKPLLSMMEAVTQHCIVRETPQWLVRAFAWKVIGSYQVLGLREGLADGKLSNEN